MLAVMGCLYAAYLTCVWSKQVHVGIFAYHYLLPFVSQILWIRPDCVVEVNPATVSCSGYYQILPPSYISYADMTKDI